MNIREQAQGISEQIVAWRRDLHRIPEVGLNLPQTSAYVCKCLDEMGITYQTYEDQSGVVAVLGKGPGKVIALRADMDALNVEEKNNLEYASKNGKMHACGHDAHAAMLLGAAKLLKDMEGQLKGQVKLIFQPDEEGISGAPAMIKDGVLENPKVDEMYAIHVGSILGKGLEMGDVLYKKGAMFASSDGFRIVINGKGGHASTPFRCNNPINAAAHYIECIQGLVSREVTYNVPTVLVVTSVKGGNDAVNIIPDSVELLGGLRTQDAEVRQRLQRRMAEILKACETEFGVEAKLEFLNGCAPTINNDEMVDKFLKSAEKIVSKEHLIELKESSMGGEDASAFFEKVPGCYVCLYNACPSDDGIEYPHHNARFCIDDSVLYIGTGLFVQAVVDELM